MKINRTNFLLQNLMNSHKFIFDLIVPFFTISRILEVNIKNFKRIADYMIILYLPRRQFYIFTKNKTINLYETHHFVIS